MEKRERIVALVPLRGGSKSIPKKNIIHLAGKPLCAWCIEAALHSSLIDDIYISTDSAEIANIVRGIDKRIKIIERPPELAKDESSTESVMLHFAQQVDFDILVTIQATSPLTQAAHFDEALEIFRNRNLDSMLTAVRIKRFFWNKDGTAINYNPLKRPRRQEFSGTLMENGAFYITKREILQTHECRLGGKIGIYEMPPETDVEIDEPDDLKKIEDIINRKM